MIRRLLVILALAVALAIAGRAQAQGSAYYIAPTGSDQSPCTESAPCASIPKAVSLCQSDCTIYLRSGVYYPRSEWQVSNKTGLTITAYPADIAQGYERPVIDATYAPLGQFDSILQISNSHTVTVSHIEFRNSSGRGISSSGASSNVTFDRVWVYQIGERCVGLVGSYITLNSSHVFDCAMNWADFTGGGGWPAAVSSWWQSGTSVPSDHIAIVDTLIQRVHGEALIFYNVDFGSALRVTILEAKSVAAYLDNATHITIDDLTVNVQDPAYRKNGGRYAHCVQFGSEAQVRAVTAITISNGTFSGCDTGVDFFCYLPSTCGYGDVHIYNNRINARTCDICIDRAQVVSGQNVVSNNTLEGRLTLAQSGQWRVDNNAFVVFQLTETPTPTSTPTPTATPTAQPGSVRFAVIGDFGHEESGAADDVAALVDSWGVEFIITTGDNCYYPAGDQMDRCVGQFYADYIFPYFGNYGAGSPTGANRFWPTMGNHEYEQQVELYYWTYFTLPGNERYYTLRRGPVEFFMLNSNSDEPDGNTSNSPQAVWLQNALSASTAPWQVVAFHHPPFTSGNNHGGSPTRDWPYAAWGADAVFSGHEHLYERLLKFGIPYFVNGFGGRSLYTFALTPVAGSQVRFNADYGAQLVEADSTSMRFRAFTRAGVLVDDYRIQTGPTPTPAPPTATPTPTITPFPSSTPTPAPNGIFADGFESGNTSAWAQAVGGADLSAQPAAALVGAWGLRATINDLTGLYVRDNSPANESRYRAEFLFDPNSLTMAISDTHLIFQANTPTASVVQLSLQYSAGGYRLTTQVKDGAGLWQSLAAQPMSDAPHLIEIDWQAGANGSLALSIDGELKETKAGLANGAHRVDWVRIGPFYGIDATTSGAEYFDAFESDRGQTTATPTPTPTWTPTSTPSATSSPSASPSPSATPSSTPSETATATETATLTQTPTAVWVQECAGQVVVVGQTVYCFGP